MAQADVVRVQSDSTDSPNSPTRVKLTPVNCRLWCWERVEREVWDWIYRQSAGELVFSGRGCVCNGFVGLCRSK